MGSFEYPKLDLDQPSFRLLRLFGGDAQTLQCELFEAFTNQHGNEMPYEALSYTWGGTDKPETITANGQPLNVTIQLRQALNQLRLPHSDRILWIDAICIDQQNIKERNHQVGQMTSIYKNADRTIFWLGQATYTTNVVLDSLKMLETVSSSVACKSWKRTDKRWRLLWATCQTKLAKRYPDLIPRQREGLQDLLQRPWFERVWIIQEVAMARRGTVYCGTRSVSANIFALSPHLFDIKPTDQAMAILEIMPGQIRRDSWWNQRHDLYTLLCAFGSSKSQDPRDMIYALLGIASDPNLYQVLAPDYEKSERDIVRECIAYFCQMDMDSLSDSICGYWNFRINDETVPGFLKTIHSLYAAALDHHIRNPNLDRALDFVTRCGHNILVTDELLGLSHKKSGVAVLECLIRTHGNQSMLEHAAAQWTRLKWIGFLLDSCPSTTSITESVLLMATQSPKPVQVINFLVKERKADVSLTDNMLSAGASSTRPRDVLCALATAFGDKFTFTSNVVSRLKNNESDQAIAALAFLEHQSNVSERLRQVTANTRLIREGRLIRIPSSALPRDLDE